MLIRALTLQNEYRCAVLAVNSDIAIALALRACMRAQHERYDCAGYSHLTGGYPGGQAQFVRVPYGVAPV